MRDRLGSRRGFVWLKREITPKQRQEIYRLGLPGVGFLAENKRVYPNSAEVSHLIGHVNIDNQGIAGIEKWLDGHGLQALHLAGLATDRLQKPVELAVDLRVQHALRDELIFAANKFKVKAAAGLVVDVETGEIISMVSLPDYDPNSPKQANDPLRINRLTTGVFELGSTFKALTLAMALDSGKFNLNSTFDARGPLHYGRFIIHDYHAQNRVLTRAGDFHLFVEHRHRARWRCRWASSTTSGSCKKMGQLDRLRTELPESAEPLVPKRWGELNTVTIAFGHGLVGRAAAGGRGDQRAGQRRLSDPADLHEAHQGRGDEARQGGHQAGDQREDALPDAAQRREGHRQARPTCRATTSAARPAPRRRWSAAATPRPSCSTPSPRSCRPTSRAIRS